MRMIPARRYAEYVIFKGIKVFIWILPRKLCLFMGKLIGQAFYAFDKRHRLIAISNLKSALGSEFPSSSLSKIARKSFVHFGKTLVDVIKFSYLDEERRTELITVEGEANLDDALEMEKGALLFTAHFGNWEVAPFYLSKKGRFNVIARRLDNILLEKELIKIRTALGSLVFYKQQAAKPTLQALRAKEMVAILIDQNVFRNQAVFVDFFGKTAATTPSLAAFFLRTESPLLPAFCYPTARDTYHLKIMKPLNIELSGDYNQDVLKITQICTKIIEAQIRKNPECWAWFHNRWKTRPEIKAEK